MGFSKNLCNLMQKREVSSYKLAKSIGVHVSTVSNWREGKSPLVEHVKRVADYFEVSIDELLSADSENNEEERSETDA